MIGDRLEDLSPLADKGPWDAVVDTSAYVPRAVRDSVEAFRPHAQRYLFISTISVYADPAASAVGSPVLGLEDPTTETVTAETYGGLKVLCEQEAARWGDGNWIVRPGLVAGPHDPTDRFTYWVDRVARCQAFVGPKRLDQSLQVIDVRALAEFAILGLEQGVTETVNAVGPSLTFGEWFSRIGQELGVGPFELLPQPEEMALPLDAGEHDALFRVDAAPAHDLGLRPFAPEETIRATWEWWQNEGRALSNVPEGSPDVPR